PLISLAGWAYSRRYHAQTERLQETWGRAATLVEETIAGIRVVKGIGAGRPLAGEFRTRSGAIVARALDIARLDAVFMPALEFLPLLGLLHVAPGESLALVGPTGSGKSTIAGLLARLYDPDGGAVLLDGHNVRDLRLSDVRQAVALVFEETFLFTDTVKENIRFARPDAADEEIERAAALAGAAEFIADLPEGYQTVLGERGFSLSGGQRHRVAIARAILADPAVLVLDDATSAVDATKEHEIRAALTTVMQGRTTLVIAHRPATIALADRVAVLDGGRIVEEG